MATAGAGPVLILWECLLDPESCWFEFLPMEALDRRFLDHSVDLPAQRFLLKLLSHLDEWKTVHQETEDGKVRYVAEPTATEADLMSRSDDQITLLALLNGPCNLGELSPICQLSPFQTWRCIRRLQETGLVRKVEGAPVPTLPQKPAAC